jgi:DNA replication protein DnaC
VHPHVLVIDELGYQSYATDAANVLFRVVSQRHLKHRSTIVTTNKPLAALGQVLHDPDLAEAILDRLLERGTHYVLRGRSYRTRHHKEEGTTEFDAAWPRSSDRPKFRENPGQSLGNPQRRQMMPPAA